ncbi:MAG TPA: glycosyltransferase family 87 protein [Polyangiales bacterium]|nr:glycosyltransferase family 87 protein [Polyangiales bacterium]
MKRIAVITALALYVALGIHAQVQHLAQKPLPQFLMEDYGYYAQAFARWQHGQSPYADHTIGTAFLYPPPSLLLVGGLEALGPLATKYAGYATLSLLALVMTIILAVRGVRPHEEGEAREGALRALAARQTFASDERVYVAIVLALGFAPVAWCLYLGQVNLFVMFTLAAGFYLADRHPVAAGSAIAVGAAIKLTPVALLVLMLRPRYARVFVGFAATLAGLTIVTALVFGVELFGDYVGTVRALKDSFPLGLNGSLSLINTLYLLAGAVGVPTEGWHGAVQLLWTASVGAMMLGGAWLARKGEQRHLFFALVALGMTVVPNVLWYHHLVFVIPALLTLWLSPQSTPWLRAGAVTAFAVMQLDALLSPKLDKLTTTPVLVLLMAATLAALVLRAPRRLVLRDAVIAGGEVRGRA